MTREDGEVWIMSTWVLVPFIIPFLFGGIITIMLLIFGGG